MSIQRFLLAARIKKIKKRFDRLVFFIATPTHGNLGDQAIVFAQRNILGKLNPGLGLVEITKYEYLIAKTLLPVFVTEDDIVVINGGGNIGSLWPDEDSLIRDALCRFQNRRMLIFPQTVYFGESDQGHKLLDDFAACVSNHENLTIMVRDRASFDCFRNKGIECIFAPDVVMSLIGDSNMSWEESDRRGALLCLRDDKEKAIPSESKTKISEFLRSKNIEMLESSTVISADDPIVERNRSAFLFQKWSEFSKARLVITDRLHAMVFAAITRTPCIAFDNLSGKVSGGYWWIAELPFIFMADSTFDIEWQIETVLACSEDACYSERLQGGLSVLTKAVEDAVG